MIKLKNVKIYNFKCIETEQSFDIEDDITVLVGMNESGKTSILQALAKVNYFESDEEFKFNLTHDYPRKKKKAVDKSGEDPIAVELTYLLSDKLIIDIETEAQLKLDQKEIKYIKKYSNKGEYSNFINIIPNDFLTAKFKQMLIDNNDYIEDLSKINNIKGFESFISTIKSNGENLDTISKLKNLSKYYINSWNWENSFEEYFNREIIDANLPKFMYYDDYYSLPSRIHLNKLQNSGKKESSEKTARALLDLADIDINALLQSNSFEDYKAEVEATQMLISNELFKYWTTNKNIRINFDIDKIEDNSGYNNRIVEHVLDIRVLNTRSGVTLPLKNRSKGFNWFFSFLVWFKKIQEDKKSTYILLLDEPGLNLHAMAQDDLLKFFKDLADEYQIIYSTHSPFMIDSNSLGKVRTVVEKEDGTHISNSVQEKDPNTLFPLQAALGYNIAQNLFISKKNLVVEGIADLVYLNLFSNILFEKGRVGLNNDITIVPVGGIDKVATFISLLRGNNLDIVCLLDTFNEQSAKDRLHNLEKELIIKDKRILFYHEFTGERQSDVEDMFEDSEYLKIFNATFSTKINISQIDEFKPILIQLRNINLKKFNHYSVANYLIKNINSFTFTEKTIEKFEKLFVKINKLFG